MKTNTIVLSDAGEGLQCVRFLFGEHCGEDAGKEISSQVVSTQQAAAIVWEALTGERVEEDVRSGSRNSFLFDAAVCLVLAGGLREDTAVMLENINQRRCVPPLPQGEVKHITDEAFKKVGKN